MWVAIGLGPNDVAVPCLWFHLRGRGEEYISNYLGEPDTQTKKATTWDTGDGEVFEKKYNEETEEYTNNKATGKFFTKYYGGCGECYRIVLQEVEEATPFVPFDLD